MEGFSSFFIFYQTNYSEFGIGSAHKSVLHCKAYLV